MLRNPSRRNRSLFTSLWAFLVIATASVVLLAPSAGAATEDAAADPDITASKVIPSEGTAKVLAVTLDGAVDPVMVDIVDQSIADAENDGYDIVMFEIDTPGGLVSSMKEVLDLMLNTDIPTVAWVSPRGAQAASAGTFIVQAADVAAMSPSTTIGSASVVGAQGKDVDETLQKKITNELVSRGKSIADEHGRNGDWVEDAVRKASNLSATEALEQNVVNFIATSRQDLLEQMDGFNGVYRSITLNTADAEVTEWDIPGQLKILKVLINPNWIFLMLTLGVIGIGFEVTHPGSILPGTVGLIAFVIAMYGLQVLPTNTAGLLLLALAIALFISEVFVTSGGILGVGGAVALFLGGLLLFDRDSAVSVDMPLLLVMGGSAAGMFILLGRKVARSQAVRVEGGSEGMIDQVGEVRHELDPEGQIFIHGEIWEARMADGSSVELPVGSMVRVTEMDGLTLVVVPDEAVAPSPAPASD